VIPTKSYLVCGTPRSGSSLLCGYLSNTKIAGNPEEYYWKDNEAEGYEKWGIKTYEEYLAKTIELGTTENGVFGAKVMWGYMEDFLTKLRSITNKPFISDKELLEHFFPKLDFLFIIREDEVAEAVSWAIAGQTGIWFHGDTRTPEKEAVYNFEMIDTLVYEVQRHNREWNEWFTQYEINPYRITYEELVAKPQEIILGALSHLGLEHDKGIEIVERNKRQGNAINIEWKNRYLADKKNR
jgi:LPS sulfotransferase NodH